MFLKFLENLKQMFYRGAYRGMCKDILQKVYNYINCNSKLYDASEMYLRKLSQQGSKFDGCAFKKMCVYTLVFFSKNSRADFLKSMFFWKNNEILKILKCSKQIEFRNSKNNFQKQDYYKKYLRYSICSVIIPSFWKNYRIFLFYFPKW